MTVIKFKNFLILFVLFLIFIFLFAFFKETNIYDNIYNNKKSKAIVIINDYKIFVDLAQDEKARRKGLGGRESLKENEGMLFVFEKLGKYGFWMKDMLFPIDIIWIKNNQVVGWNENLSPKSGGGDNDLEVFYPPEEVNFVLEVPKGTVRLLNLQKGMEVIIKPLN